MSRQDIHVDAIYGEVNTSGNIISKVFYPFEFLKDITDPTGNSFEFGEVIVPESFKENYRVKNNIRVSVPYCASYKQFRIRFRIDNGEKAVEYFLNPVNNSQWFPVYKEDSQGDKIPVYVSELRVLNRDERYNLVIHEGYLMIYSANETDLVVNTALPQNEVFLLKASAGNLYQYPTTGVGLIDFLHGNFENTGLAQKLQEEFENDGMVINNAYMDSLTGELVLETKEKNG